MEIFVYEVDWKEFTATFPEPGEWATECDTQPDHDDYSLNIESSSVYVKLRGKLPDVCVKALDLLFSSICINGVPKKLDRSSVYQPAVKFDKKKFQFACDGPVIPRSSPEQVSLILDALAAIPKGDLEEAIKSNWSSSGAEIFENAREFIAYIKGWIKVLKSIRKAKKGLSVDILT